MNSLSVKKNDNDPLLAQLVEHFISYEEVGSSYPATRGRVGLHCITGSGLQLIGGDVKAPKEQRL